MSPRRGLVDGDPPDRGKDRVGGGTPRVKAWERPRGERVNSTEATHDWGLPGSSARSTAGSIG